MVDFVNGSSDNIGTVQFVIMTEVIEAPEEDEAAQQGDAAASPDDRTFFEKLKALFEQPRTGRGPPAGGGRRRAGSPSCGPAPFLFGRPVAASRARTGSRTPPSMVLSREWAAKTAAAPPGPPGGATMVPTTPRHRRRPRHKGASPTMNAFIDTRGNVTEALSFCEAIVQGIAPGGGLFVPRDDPLPRARRDLRPGRAPLRAARRPRL